MRAIILLGIVFNIQTAALAEESQVKALSRLIESVEASPTHRIWHEQKERLETQGYEIWQEFRKKQNFCEELQELPDSQLDTVIAWNLTSKSVCSDRLIKRYKDYRAQQQQTDSVFFNDLSLQPCNPNKGKRKRLGPTREQVLDTTGGPRLVRGDLAKCEVALTFDDGPHPVNTPQLLKVLAEQRVRANFFTVGRYVDRHPYITDETAKMGHVVGNHSYSHKNFPKLKYNAAVQEINGGFKSLLKIWDYTTPFFRFPFGAITKKTRAYNQSHNVAEFFWNMDTRDWAIKDPKALLKKVFQEIDREKRGILLFHDIQPQTIDVMPKVLVALKEAGYTTAVFVPEDLIEDDFPN